MLSSDPLPSTTKREPKTKKLRQRRPLAAEALAHTINEFAARARVSRVTLYRMMNDGQLRFIRLRGRRLIPCSEYTRLGLVPAES
jgi:excisionase family DNA binding protein